jgi:cytosine/adenosine deaminase-related metal-dependent hydrolase
MSPEIGVRRLLARPGADSVAYDVILRIRDGRIAAIEPADDSARDQLAMPALVNAHDHGYGVRTLAFGGVDDALEPWIASLRLRPRVDPYLECLVAFARMAAAGIGATMHCHNSLRAERLVEEAAGVVRAAREVGIRLAFSCPILDRNAWVLGGPEALRPFLSEPHWLALAPSIPRFAPAEEQLARVDAVAAAHAGPCVNVQYGPIGPQWCAERTLALIAEASARTGRRVHMHLLESRRQRAWLDRTYPQGIVHFLDEIGLLSPRLAVAHGVWLREDECALLAERGVTVVSNPSANLRLRSGTAPIGRLLAAGTRFAFGLDGTALDDDQDLLRELRLARLLHGGTGLVPALTAASLWQAALVGGARVIDDATDRGALEPGMAADILVLDYEVMAGDVLDGAATENEVLLARATARHVQRLIVGGREVVRDGALVNVDLAAAERELTSIARAEFSRLANERHLVVALQEAIRRYYQAF